MPTIDMTTVKQIMHGDKEVIKIEDSLGNTMWQKAAPEPAYVTDIINNNEYPFHIKVTDLNTPANWDYNRYFSRTPSGDAYLDGYHTWVNTDGTIHNSRFILDLTNKTASNDSNVTHEVKDPLVIDNYVIYGTSRNTSNKLYRAPIVDGKIDYSSEVELTIDSSASTIKKRVPWYCFQLGTEFYLMDASNGNWQIDRSALANGTFAVISANFTNTPSTLNSNRVIKYNNDLYYVYNGCWKITADKDFVLDTTSTLSSWVSALTQSSITGNIYGQNFIELNGDIYYLQSVSSGLYLVKCNSNGTIGTVITGTSAGVSSSETDYAITCLDNVGNDIARYFKPWIYTAKYPIPYAS